MKKGFLVMFSTVLFSALLVLGVSHAQTPPTGGIGGDDGGGVPDQKVEICTKQKGDTIVSVGSDCPAGSKLCRSNPCD